MIRAMVFLALATFASAGVLAAAPATATAATPAASETTTHVRGEFSFKTGPEPDFVIVRKVAAQWPKDGPGSVDARWRNWLIDSQIDRRRPAGVHYSDSAFEAIAPELVSHVAKHSIEFNPGYQQLVIHRVEVRRNGVWTSRLDPAQVSLARREDGFERDMADGQVTALIVLADVRAGDIVRISHTITGNNPILAGSLTDGFNMAWIDPILDRHVRVIHPAATAVETKTFGTVPKGGLEVRGDAQEIVFHNHQAAAVRHEGDYPNWYTPYPRVQVAARRSWADVVAWARPLYPEPVVMPAELQQRIAAWKQLPDPHARATAVLRAVQDEVRYFGTELGDNTHRPALPELTWQRRYGDCKDKAFLVTVLLRALGIEAEPALVSMSNGKATLDMLPAASVFDHVIVRARIEGETYWLDPTLTQQRGDLRMLGLRDYGAALPIAAGVDALVPVLPPKRTDNSVTIGERFSPVATGSEIDLLVRSEYTGRRAEIMRLRLNSSGAEEMSRNFADFYRKRYSELSVSSPMRVEEAAEDHLVITEHYLIKDGWENRQGAVRQIELYAHGLSSDAGLPSTIDRIGPVDLAQPSLLRQEVTVVLPPGWSVASPPPDASISTAEISYSRNSASSKDALVIAHKMQILSDHVPSDRVAGYLRGLREVNDALGIRLGIQTHAGAVEAERKDRLKQLLRKAMEEKGAAL